VWLTEAERGELEDDRGDQAVADFAREALATLPRYRSAIAEIEDMIRGCRLAEKAGGNSGRCAETQRRTLEHVLGLLQPPRDR
jgi:hypothetical protein